MKRWFGKTLIGLNALTILIGIIFGALALDEIPTVASFELTLQKPFIVLLIILGAVCFVGLITLEMYLVMTLIINNMD